MKQLAIVVAATLAGAQAHADVGTQAASAELALLAQAISHRDAKAFAAEFRDGSAIALFPDDLASESLGRDNIEAGAAVWLKKLGPDTVKIDKLKSGKGTMGAWVFATLVAGRHTYRITGIVGSGKAPAAAKAKDYKLIAVDISEGVADADSIKNTIHGGGQLRAVPEGGDEAAQAFLPDKLGTTDWEPSAYGIVVGSGPGEIVEGKAIAGLKKMWTGFGMTASSALGLSDADDNAVHVLSIVVAHVAIAAPNPTKGEKPVPVKFRVLVAGNPGMAGSDKPQLLVAHFSVAPN